MKTLMLFLSMIFVFFLFFSGCLVTVIGDVTVEPTQPVSLIKLVALALLAIYELIVRLIPSIGDYSVISWLIKFLKWISDGLNNKVTR